MNGSSSNSAVFFDERDYIGVGRRLLIDVVDAGLAWIVCVVLTNALEAWTSPLLIVIWVPIALTARLLFAVAGPFNVILDLLWVSSDSCRQALRDKFAHTFVVRANAQPAGTGKIVYRTYTVFGGTMLFAEVQPDA